MGVEEALSLTVFECGMQAFRFSFFLNSQSLQLLPRLIGLLGSCRPNEQANAKGFAGFRFKICGLDKRFCR